MGKIYSWFVYGGTIMNMVVLFQLLIQMISLSIFLTSILQYFTIVNKFIINFPFPFEFLLVLFIVSIIFHVQGSFYLRFLMNILGNL